MLLNVREYHRPGGPAAQERLNAALALLARTQVRTAAVAGGGSLLASGDRSVEAVVDLQGLGLDEVVVENGRLRVGAMVTRTALAALNLGMYEDFGRLEALICEGARRWGGSLQRNRATVGAAAAVAASDDPLMVALLACDASVILHDTSGAHEIDLAAFLPRRAELLAAPALITDLIVPPAGPNAGAALAAVGRSPLDEPIVVAAALLRLEAGQPTRCRAARLALGGAGAEPARLAEVEAMLAGRELSDDIIAAAAGRVSELVTPAGDFRGSAEYRKAVAGVLSARALQEAWERAR